MRYLICKNKKKLTDDNFDEIIGNTLKNYDQILQEYVYEKIWSELSGKEKEIMKIMALNKNAVVLEIREKLGVDSGYFGSYSDRLKNKGVVYSDGYGELKFTLPRFDVYINSII